MATNECPEHCPPLEGCPQYCRLYGVDECSSDYNAEGCPNHYYADECPQHNSGYGIDECLSDYRMEGCPQHCSLYGVDECPEHCPSYTGCPRHCPEHADECPQHNSGYGIDECPEHCPNECLEHCPPLEGCPQHCRLYGTDESCPQYNPSCPEDVTGVGAPGFEPYAGEYPTPDIPTYEEYAAQFPSNQLPTYEQYKEQFPQLTLERYQEYGKEYPGLGEMFELSEVGIRQLMSNTGLPVEELMRAYSAEEKAMLDEYLPQLREQWSSQGLLRSGMTVKQELKAVGESARKMATTRAGLEKESVIFQRQGLEAGVGLAMQHAGMSQQVSADAFRAGQEEYHKTYDAGIAAGLNEHQARVQGYNAQINEHVKQFTSSVEAQKFVQGMEERAFQTGREEWQKVFDSQVAKGLTEFEAEQAAYEAGRGEYARVQELEFEKWQTEYVEEMKKYLMELGFSAQQAAAAAQGWGNIFGTVIGLLLQSILGL